MLSILPLSTVNCQVQQLSLIVGLEFCFGLCKQDLLPRPQQHPYFCNSYQVKREGIFCFASWKVGILYQKWATVECELAVGLGRITPRPKHFDQEMEDEGHANITTVTSLFQMYCYLPLLS